MDDRTEALATALAEALGARAGDIEGLRRLSGGASRETWSFDCCGRPLILQRDRPGRSQRAGMAAEAELLRAAADPGVPVAEVVATGSGAGPSARTGGAGPLDRPWSAK